MLSNHMYVSLQGLLDINQPPHPPPPRHTNTPYFLLFISLLGRRVHQLLQKRRAVLPERVRRRLRVPGELLADWGIDWLDRGGRGERGFAKDYADGYRG